MSAQDPLQPSGNPYLDFLNQQDQAHQPALKKSVSDAADKNPERQAQVLRFSQKTGLPPDLVDRNFDAIKKRAEVEDTDFAKMLKESPHTAEFLSDPHTAAVAKDDHAQLSYLEQLMNLGKSFVGEGIKAPGSGLVGLGNLNDIASRALARVIHFPEWANVPIPDWINPTKILQGGAYLEQKAQSFAVPPEQQNLGTAIAGGLGQLGGIAMSAVVAGPEAIPALFAGQGARGAEERAAQLGKKNTPEAERAQVYDAAMNALLGEMGFEGILNRVPQAVKGPLLRRFVDIATSAGIQGVTQAGIQLASNLAEKITINPNQPITQDLVQQALVGGATGGIARGVLGVALPDLAKHLRKIDQGKQTADFFTALGEGVKDSKTFQRLPERLQKLVLEMTKDGPVENTYLPVEEVQEFAQSQKLDPGDFMEQVMPGGREKFNQAVQTGEDIQVPTGVYATKIAAGDAAKHFNEVVRLGNPEAMNAREAQQFEAQLKSEKTPPPTPTENEQSAKRVSEDIRGQLTGLGFMPAAVDAYARMYEQVFRTVGERAGVDPFQLYEPYQLQITRPLPEVLTKLPDADTRLDTLIDKLRSGKLPAAEEMFGKSLVDFIREKGGVQDEGGDLASREIDKERKPFQKRVVNPEGLPADQMREAAAEAGYLPKQSSISDFMDAIDKEVRGEPVYAQGQEVPEALEQRLVLEQLDSYLKSRDIDVQKASNAEIKEALNQAAKEPSIDARTGRVLDQAAYHGSPHIFDKFDLQKIGTGEGAQAYGWGLYFAGNKAVADAYRQALNDWYPNGVPTKPGSLEDRAAAYVATFLEARSVDPYGRTLQQLAQLEGKDADRLRDIVKGWRAEGVEFKKAGRTYHVDIPESSDFIDYDKPLPDATAQRIADKLKVKPVDVGHGIYGLTLVGPDGSGHMMSGISGTSPEGVKDNLWRWLAATTGQGAYRDLSRWFGSPRRASEFLSSIGIAGLKYLDQGSRGGGVRSKYEVKWSPDQTRAGVYERATGNLIQEFDHFDEADAWVAEQGKPDETHNYVLFDDKLAKITSYEQQLDLEKRGRILFGDNRQFRIELLDKADLSTFLHETGHFYLEVLGDVVDELKTRPGELNATEQQMVGDYSNLLRELGVENREALGVDQHEQFARSFEAYLREGKAPSPEMRTMFQRFASWLTQIYKSLTQLNVNLSPEVRAIFDRLLASDQDIERAQHDAGIEAKIKDQEQAQRLGLSPEEFRAYGDTVRKARDQAKEDLYGQYLEEFNERQAEWYTRKRDDTRQAVAAEVHGQRDYIALSYLRDGKLPDGSALPEGVQAQKLDAGALEERYGKYKDSSVMKALRDQDLYRREGGADPEAVAGMFGYSSGDEMVQALLKLRPMDELIEAETTDRMRQQYGDMLTDGTAAEKARDAVMTDGRAKVIEREMQAYARKVRETEPFRRLGANEAKREDREARQVGAETLRRFVPSVSLARDIAQRRINDMRVRDVNSGVHYAAARREGLAAIDAANRGDFQKALTHAQNELISVAMYEAARDVQQEVTKGRDFLQTFDKQAKRERIGKAGGDYLEQIDKLLERFDFSKKTLKDVDKMASLRDFIESEQAKGHELDIPVELQNEAARKNYRDMTVSEFRGLRDAVKSIEHWANFKNKLIRNVSKRELDQLGADGTASIDGNSRGPGKKLTLEMRLPGSEKPRRIQSFFLAHLPLGSILREMDGFKDGGFLFENVMRPIDEAGNAEAVRLEKATTDVMGIYRDAYKGEESTLWHTTYIPEINDKLSKWGRLMVALNWGNEGNRQRVMGGFGWNEGQVRAVLDGLDERDWKFVQDVWKHIDSYWPEIAAKQKRVTGVAPDKVEGVPIQTKFGEIQGGYFPIVYEGRLTARAAGNDEASFAKLIQQSSYTKATTARGHTEARMKNVKMPLRLDPGVITEHLHQVIHDLTHHEMLIDVGRLLGRKDIQDSIYKNYGDVAYKEIKSHIRDIALGNTPAPDWYRTFAAIRSNAVTARLGWNMVTTLVHVPNITSGMVRVGAKWVVKGAIDSLSSAKGAEHSAQWVAEQSDMMRLRWKHRMVELSEFRDQIGLNRGKLSSEVHDAAAKIGIDPEAVSHFKDSYLMAIHRVLQLAEIPTWVGAYEKAVASGREPADARAQADRAILDSIGGGQIKDQVGVQKNAIGKIFTTFMTYSLSMHRLGREVLLKNEGTLQKGIDAALLMAVPLLFVGGVHHLVRPPKKDETLGGEVGNEVFDHAVGMFVGLRELQGALRGPDYSGPAAFGVVGTGKRFVFEGEKALTADEQKAAKARKAALKSGNELAGELFGYPAYQVDKTIEGTLGVWEGKNKPSAILFGPPPKK